MGIYKKLICFKNFIFWEKIKFFYYKFFIVHWCSTHRTWDRDWRRRCYLSPGESSTTRCVQTCVCCIHPSLSHSPAFTWPQLSSGRTCECGMQSSVWIWTKYRRFPSISWLCTNYGKAMMRKRRSPVSWQRCPNQKAGLHRTKQPLIFLHLVWIESILI